MAEQNQPQAAAQKPAETPQAQSAKQPQKPAEEPESKPITNNAPAQKPGGGGSAVGIIILIIVLILAVLGVGGWFGFKYFVKKSVSKVTGLATTSSTATTGKVSVKTVADSLMYPGAKVASQKQGEADSAYKAELTLETPDAVATIKSYYQNLVNQKNWKLTKQGSSGDNNYYFTITDPNFTAEVDITKYEGYDTTDIGIKISGDNLTNESISVSATATATAKKTSATTSGGVSGDYIISGSDARVISKSELTNLNAWQLKVARNEIYARHGRPFVHKDLQCYFAKKSWYSEDPNFSESSLSATENKNVATILAYEQEIGSGLLQTDSGCNTNS